jgi:uncharacterized protein (DUF2147 family)
MKKCVIASLFLLFCYAGLFAQQSPVGVWKTIDDATGEEKSHVEIYMEKGELKGKVIKLLRKNAKQICDKCSGAKHNKPILGMVVMEGLSKDGNKYSGGKILDPENGKEYKCSIWLENPDQLVVRGYIGISVIGRSQTWHRVK